MMVLVVGGAGFIGCHVAARVMARGHQVIVFDNLSRRGSPTNLAWLQTLGELEFVKGDIRDFETIRSMLQRFEGIDVIVHQAAQVAVTTSLVDPRLDFETNALGTFNLLEAARLSPKPPAILFASTNKVYGGMQEVAVVERNGRYQYRDLQNGIAETRPLDFHSPYGCSKGAAEQYVRDYARIYGLQTGVFRQSCIYGPRQFGVEDQGWVAWFTISAVLGKPITIYGDGKQVRDLLYIDDLIDAYAAVLDKIEVASGQIYNLGGGTANQLSLLELVALLRELGGKEVPLSFEGWRPGDQKVFICDIRKFMTELGWRPRVGVAEGVERLYRWVVDHRSLFEQMYPNPKFLTAVSAELDAGKTP